MPTTLSFPPREQILNHPLMLGSVVCWINLGLMSGFYLWKQVGGTAYPSRLFSLACLTKVVRLWLSMFSSSSGRWDRGSVLVILDTHILGLATTAPWIFSKPLEVGGCWYQTEAGNLISQVGMSMLTGSDVKPCRCRVQNDIDLSIDRSIYRSIYLSIYLPNLILSIYLTNYLTI